MRAVLDGDPRIPRPIQVAVSGNSGIVTLRGTVESFKQRHAAIEDVKSIVGIALTHRADDSAPLLRDVRIVDVTGSAP